MNIFDHLLNPPLYKMTMVRNIFTCYRKFLAASLVNEVEWTSDKYSYINTISGVVSGKGHHGCEFQQSWFFTRETANPELNDRWICVL